MQPNAIHIDHQLVEVLRDTHNQFVNSRIPIKKIFPLPAQILLAFKSSEHGSSGAVSVHGSYTDEKGS